MDPSVLATLQNLMAEIGDQDDWNPRLISELNLSTDPAGNLLFTFANNGGKKYVLLLLTLDARTRSITEYHAYIDILTICTPSTEITDDTFDHLVNSLRAKYLRVSRPIQDGDHRMAVIIPGRRPERHNNAHHRIVTSHLSLEENNQICVRAQTHSDLIYILALQPSFTSYGLSAADCKFLIYAMYLLCKGTVLQPKAFLADTLFFREIYPSFTLEVFKEPQCYKINFMACSEERSQHLPKQIHDAVEEILETSPWLMPGMSTTLKLPAYPLICIVSKLRTDPDGLIFSALRRSSPCAIRIFDEQVNTSTFFGSTVKQLLLMDPHPNVVGVIDYFLGPPRSILLEDMRGADLTTIIEEKQALDEDTVVKFSIGIARGISFLHSYGVVHHELGLFNIIVCDNRPKIACIEFGFIDLKTSHSHMGNILPSDALELDLLTEDGVRDVYDRFSNESGAIPDIRMQVNGPNGLRIEVLQHPVPTNSYADRADVACFGVLMWEMLTGSQLLVNDNSKMTEARLQALVFEQKEILMELLVNNGVHDRLIEVIDKCWHAEPARRPPMSQVLEILEHRFKRLSSTLILNNEDDFIAAHPSEDNDDYNSSNEPGFIIDASKVEGSTSRTAKAASVKLEGHTAAVPKAAPADSMRNNAVATSTAPEKSQMEVRETRFIRDDLGNEIDLFANYERRYPYEAGVRAISGSMKAFLNLRDSFVTVNALENSIVRESVKISAYYFCPPGINQIRRREAFALFGNEIMEELDKGFSLAVDCTNAEAIFKALTSPYRGIENEIQATVTEKTHLRVVLSYRHEHPDKRKQLGWLPRQRISEDAYRRISARIVRYARSRGAETVAVWTDQHFAGANASDSWGNSCLLPYAVYPVVFLEDGDRNENRLWICAEHQLALSGEGIFSEVNELSGVWRKTTNGAVAGKLLPLCRGLAEATCCLLPNITTKETYHAHDRDDIISWTRAIAFLGYSRDIWKVYKSMPVKEIASELAASVLIQGFSPTWIVNHTAPRWKDGAVLRTSNWSERVVMHNRKGWHGLWDWIQMRKEYVDSSEIFATIEVERCTVATQIESDDAMYGFVFLIGLAGQLCRSSVVKLRRSNDEIHVQKVCVLSDYHFTNLAASLKLIACMEENETNNCVSFTQVRNRSLKGEYPRNRKGTPALQAVNEVLKAVHMHSVTHIKHKFLTGHEIHWN